VSEDGVNHKDLTGYIATMVLKYEDDAGNVIIEYTQAGTLIPDDKLDPGDPDTYLNGNFNITIDKSATILFPTRVPADLDVFATSFEYFYHIDINGPASDDLRVLRGKAAVRR